MTAHSIGIYTIDFPDPNTLAGANNHKFRYLNAQNSFQFPISDNIRTLSTNGVSPGEDRHGILFVPEPESKHCKRLENGLVPPSATRIQHLPRDTDYSTIAVVPWSPDQPECVKEYLASAKRAEVNGCIVFQPGDTAAMPPPMSDPSWILYDGGRWRAANPFPVYAISPICGQILMDNLNLYSGNVSDAPNAQELLSIYQPSDYIRLWANIQTGKTNNLPSLWVFLLIILGLLMCIIGTTSVSMHVVQRRRRRELRQRVIDGEIDLEALGIKKLTVPQAYLDKMPLYTYTEPLDSSESEKGSLLSPPSLNSPPPTSLAADPENGSKTSLAELGPLSAPSVGTAPPAFSQPTCAICLDDFEPHVTQVRELPCRHIFHPDCVDTFLLRNSSLCPMCKASALPVGSCPAKITNAMVRRERMVRRMRERSAGIQGPSARHMAAPLGVTGLLGHRARGVVMGTRRVVTAPEPARVSRDIEMAGPAQPLPIAGFASQQWHAETRPRTGATQSTHSNGDEVPLNCSPAHNRREWARQRALAMLGRGYTPAVAEDGDEAARQTTWKRLLHKVFPGFR